MSNRRREIIRQIEAYRNSKVLVYFVGDRPIFNAAIAGDSIRWIYEHLRNMSNDERVKTIDFYLYSLGGSLEVPWPIISILREYCENLNVLVTYKAFSATTLIALGADKILMGRKGELGPIDPQMVEEEKGGAPGTGYTRPMSTEDISSYLSFIKDRVGIEDQDALAALTKSLTDTISPPALGQINRVHSHIRAVANKMLSQAKPALDPEKIQDIIKTLTERTLIHGHSIGRHEARQIGLQVEDMEPELERMCWDLFVQYERDLKLNSFTNPLAYFESDDQDEYVEENAVVACIESADKCHEYSGPLRLQKIRHPMPQINLNVNVPVQFPDDVSSRSMPEQVQQILQEFQQNLAGQLRNMVAEQVRNSMPVEGISLNNVKMAWREVCRNNATCPT